MNIFKQMTYFSVNITSTDNLKGEVNHLTKSYPPSRLGYHLGKEKVKALVTLAIVGKVKPCKNIRIKLVAHGIDGMEVLLYRQTVRASN